MLIVGSVFDLDEMEVRCKLHLASDFYVIWC